MIQETMLQIPDPEPDPMATVVERVPTPGSEEIAHEAQAAALYAQLQAAVAAKDWVSTLATGAYLQELEPDYRDVQAVMANVVIRIIPQVTNARKFVIIAVFG